ncbi:MAG: YidC/Oxa1 family membrane protein insertase [Patescibacteria group bacterium]|jgi:YidC/Oxa1 family membrane protein insertase
MGGIIRTLLYQPLYNVLVFLAWLIPGHSIGWSIIILTILVRLLLLPTSLKAAKAQAHIQVLQPKINEIRKKYKSTTEQSKALVDLYKEEGVSQFGACLPLLAQFPLLIVLYIVFQNIVKSGVDLSLLYSFTPHPDTLSHFWFGLDVTKPNLWVLPILAGVTQFVLSRMTTPPITHENTEGVPDPTKVIQQMSYVFPVVTIIFARQFPAAISLYWVISTLIGIAQQWYVNKHIKTKIRVSSGAVNKSVSTGSKTGVLVEKENKKKNLLSKVIDQRLSKAEKKSGVSVTIRKKN